MDTHSMYSKIKTASAIKQIKKIVVFLLPAVLMQIKTASAQLNPFASMYFQNQYLSNPAMAGIEEGLNLNLAVRQQWATLPGSPKSQFLSGDYNAGKHVGLGLSISNDQTGLLRQTMAVATYAYHVILGGNNQQLNFGLSAGVSSQHINYNEVNGDEGDVQVDRYNNQNRAYPDGDFG
ncbi:MAG: type IX secretion system membrane protein PorP/SprF, partial [Hymenobacter sp.]